MSYFSRCEDIQRHEKLILASFSCCAQDSKGRKYAETEDPQRTCFQRDRDRVIHSRSYRRLKGKTQVFVAHHGDHFRNRLTHTMEVAQLSRDIARNLRLNEDLTETIALSHDLGHTPFGHAGQEAMMELMHRFGLPFEHNEQSRRIVEVLEKKSPHFSGLNLSWEVRDGIQKHRYADYESGAKVSKNGSLEAQIVDICDQITYQNHDIDDGIRSGIFALEDLQKLELWRRVSEEVDQNIPEKMRLSLTISALMKAMTKDLLNESIRRLQKLRPKIAEDVRHASDPIASFSDEMEHHNENIRHFLYAKFYKNPRVVKQSDRGKRTIKKIFFYLMKNKTALPNDFQDILSAGTPLEIAVKDFVAGMTDDFALNFSLKCDD